MAESAIWNACSLCVELEDWDVFWLVEALELSMSTLTWKTNGRDDVTSRGKQKTSQLVCRDSTRP
jgi:hypothetical protein